MRDPRLALERIFCFAALFFFSGAVFPVLAHPGTEGVVSLGDDALSKLAQTSIYAVALLLVALRWRSIQASILAARWFWLLTLLALASTAWSTDAGVTLRTGTWLVLTGLFGAYFADRFSAREQLVLVGAAIGLALVACLVFGLFLPNLAVESGVHNGAWRGAFIHKNSLGRAMALAVLAFGLLATSSWTVAPLMLTGLAGAGVLLLLSHSGTAVAVTVGLGLIVPLCVALRVVRARVQFVAIALLAFVVLVSVIVIAYQGAVLGALGKDETLTGRTVLWAVVATKIAERPWLGYGAQAFWHGRHGDYASVWQIVHWAPPHAHNGFLDLLLDVGFIGLLVFLIGFGQAYYRALAYARQAPSLREALWPIGYLTFFFLSNLSESTILRHSTIFWLLYASTASLVARPLTAPHPSRVREARDESGAFAGAALGVELR